MQDEARRALALGEDEAARLEEEVSQKMTEIEVEVERHPSPQVARPCP
jgi:hypothetical protein